MKPIWIMAALVSSAFFWPAAAQENSETANVITSEPVDKPAQLYAFRYQFPDLSQTPVWVGSDSLDGCIAAEQAAMKEALRADGATSDDLSQTRRVGTCVRLY